MTIPCQRHLFDLPDDIAYLNCGYMSPLLKAARRAGIDGLGRKSRPWEIAPADFFTAVETARELFARLIGAGIDDIAILPSASYGLATAAANLPVAGGRKILLLDGQFPSNVHCWRALVGPDGQTDGGGHLVTVRRDPSGDWTGALLDAVDDDTAIVAVPHCHWIDGGVIDLEVLGAACRRVGAAMVVDATQSLGAMPLDVATARPDFVIAASYKWLLGPYSLGFAYVAPAHHGGRPIEHHWLPRDGSRDFNGLIHYRDDFEPGARRFDVGERPNFALMPVAIAGMEQLLDWGVGAISETLGGMTETIAVAARELGLEVPPKDRRAPHYLSLRWPDDDPGKLLARLARHRVHVSARGGAIRITPHLYNNQDDIDRLLRALREAL